MDTENLIKHLESLDVYDDGEYLVNRLRDVMVLVLKELEYLKTELELTDELFGLHERGH